MSIGVAHTHPDDCIYWYDYCRCSEVDPAIRDEYTPRDPATVDTAHDEGGEES